MSGVTATSLWSLAEQIRKEQAEWLARYPEGSSELADDDEDEGDFDEHELDHLEAIKALALELSESVLVFYEEES